MGSVLWNLLFFLILIGVSVTVHELGHFLIARWCGVRVDVFSIGFGPKLFGFYGRYGTEYRISWIPLGGYVSMRGRETGRINEGFEHSKHDEYEERDESDERDGAPSHADARDGAAADASNEGAACGGDQDSHIESKPHEVAWEVNQSSSYAPMESNFANKVDLRVRESLSDRDTIERVSDSFDDKSVLQKIAILLAGSLFNFIFAFICLIATNLTGYSAYRPIVAMTIPHSMAAEAGFKANDVITHINGEAVELWSQIFTGFQDGFGSQVEVTVASSSNPSLSKTLTLDLSQIPADTEFDSLTAMLDHIGIVNYIGRLDGSIEHLKEDSFFYAKGVRQGDFITHIGQVYMSDGYAVSAYTKVMAKGQFPVQIILISGVTPKEYAMLTRAYEALNHSRSDISTNKSGAEVDLDPIGAWESLRSSFDFNYVIKEVVLPRSEYQNTSFSMRAYVDFDSPLRVDVRYGPIDAIWHGIEDTLQLSGGFLKTVGQIITADVKFNQILTGPIGLAKVAGESASMGSEFFLFLLALVSINLFFFNLLPLPVLDGGQVMIVVIEKVRGRPLGQKLSLSLSVISFLALIALILLAIFNDILAL